ncbi:microfibril-associated glycoprotein 4-like [Asterias amurensis]|uniref:microfibril-associated glycoprotein 4-like n=1 Tax=Asterias amurensis TaxID=7602 RepID=UPI003AB48442
MFNHQGHFVSARVVHNYSYLVSVCIKMDPACVKMTILVFIAVFASRARSQTQQSIGPYPTSETERCVCQPNITVNPPVCGRSFPVNSVAGCNCTTVQEILRTVSTNQETVASELEDTRRMVGEVQVTVSTNQETVSSELQDTKREVEDVQVTVSTNHENVTSEIQGLKRQLEELHLLVSTLVEFPRVTRPPKDCSEILASGVSISGVYTVQPLGSGVDFQVYCDMVTDGGGWTVFQRRKDGSVDFYLDFANYSRGFGNLEGEFWLGNDNLHRLTAQGEYELRVDLSDFENETRYAFYDSFSIADVTDNYRLTLGNYSGTAGDSLSRHNNQQFSTKDRDNDVISGNCAQIYRGAWWYYNCHDSNLNGEYLGGTTTAYARGVVWVYWKGYSYSLKTSEMKIRRTP